MRVIYDCKFNINQIKKLVMAKKIRVSTKNSKVLDGRLFITLLKAMQIKSKVLQQLIEYGNSAVFPGLGKLVEYKGAYIRVEK
jgi:hypothetical protein